MWQKSVIFGWIMIVGSPAEAYELGIDQQCPQLTTKILILTHRPSNKICTFVSWPAPLVQRSYTRTCNSVIRYSSLRRSRLHAPGKSGGYAIENYRKWDSKLDSLYSPAPSWMFEVLSPSFLRCGAIHITLHCKKRLASFPSPAGISLTWGWETG